MVSRSGRAKGSWSMKSDAKHVIWAPPMEELPLTNHEPPAPRRGRQSETLTARESDILGLIAQGFSNKSIARMLNISPETVKSHVKRIFLKLGVCTRAAAVSRAVLLDVRSREESSSSSEKAGSSWFRTYAEFSAK
jgi:DNA-binding NarL/FixJ family response regulator